MARPNPAPIKAGDQLGKMTIELPYATRTLAIRAGQDVAPLGLFNWFGAAIKYLIFGAPVIALRLGNERVRCWNFHNLRGR